MAIDRFLLTMALAWAALAVYPGASEPIKVAGVALVDDGLVTCTSQRIETTARGQLLLRNIAQCFDAYIEGSDNRYSRAV